MIKRKKETLKNTNVESVIPIGIFGSNKNGSIFCKTKENPGEIFTLASVKGSPGHFSKNKELTVFKNKILSRKLKLENIDNIVSSRANGKKIITFIYKTNTSSKLYWAIWDKKNTWKIQGPVSDVKDSGSVIPDYVLKKNFYIYYGESSIHSAFSSDFIKWKKNKDPILKSRPGFFDKGHLKLVGTRIVDKGILVIYDASTKDGDTIKIQIGAAMFSLDNPQKLIWRMDEPIFESKVPYERGFECKGIMFDTDKFSLYWYSSKIGVLYASLALPFSECLDSHVVSRLDRHVNNPIISPEDIAGQDWAAKGTFNPAALVINDKTHLLFRAVGSDGVSRIGHSFSEDGIDFDELNSEPVFSIKKNSYSSYNPTKQEYNPSLYSSGGSCRGCEDPRLINIDGKIYMTFNAFDGWDFIRVGYSSISEGDFVKGNWNKWSKTRLISPAGEINKNWVIFPEKINGKFAILHSLTPEIQIDYVDKLEDLATGKVKIKSNFGRKVPRRMWDTWIRGAGPPPLKTPEGWLVFYHAISAEESYKYKLGVMLLDLKDPKKILARSSTPILLPDMWYENDWKPGIVYACGAVIRDDTLFIYYGGGDKFVCVATVPFGDFMDNFSNITERVPLISKVSFI